ncbi:MAG: AlpA family phage regulatory protein [Verrucomicrobiota bacterium]
MPTPITTTAHRKALRLPAVLEKTGLSKTHLYRLQKQGKFPKFHKLSERVSVADETEIDAWLAEKFEGAHS